MDWRKTASVIASFPLIGLTLLDGFVVVGIVIGRVGVVTRVDFPIDVGEELLLVIVVVVGVVTIIVFRLLLIPSISISRPTTIAVILVATSAILLFYLYIISTSMDNALVLD